jgi:hypothetical protein
LEILHDGTLIRCVFVHFHSRNFDPFLGRIEGGIGPLSSIEGVIHTNGQPAQISVTSDENWEYVNLRYLEKGIDFKFRNKKLDTVTICRPLSVDPIIDQDIGDTAIYRAISPRTK